MSNNLITNIGVEHIHPHPENPRKDLGDLTELVESIKKNGVMQNLTVIPQDNADGEYTTLIGHRRYAASVKAGLKELPCRVLYGLNEKEQLSTMLEENMQRSDLTVYEQAQGFQMMLNLGETEETIADKTGFSRTTIRHRLNIAKLNQEELKQKESDESFQLSLKDLYELEKVKDVKTRDKILKESRSSRDIAVRARSEAARAKRDENAETIAKMLKKLDVEKASDKIKNEQYTSKWKTIKEFELDKDVPQEIKLPKDGKGKIYYFVSYRSLKVITRAAKEKRQLSQYELEQKEKDKKKKQIKAILKESTSRRQDFIENIITGKIKPVKDGGKEKDAIWKAMMTMGTGVYASSLRRFFLSKDEYKCTEEEKQEAREKAEKLSVLNQMLIMMHISMSECGETFDWQLRFSQGKANMLKAGYEALEPYGWYFENEDEKKVLDGTHDFFESKAKEKEMEE